MWFFLKKSITWVLKVVFISGWDFYHGMDTWPAQIIKYFTFSSAVIFRGVKESGTWNNQSLCTHRRSREKWMHACFSFSFPLALLLHSLRPKSGKRYCPHWVGLLTWINIIKTINHRHRTSHHDSSLRLSSHVILDCVKLRNKTNHHRHQAYLYSLIH